MSFFRSLWRMAFFVISLMLFLASAYFIHLSTQDPVIRRRRFSRHGSAWARFVCRVFGIRVEVKGQPGLPTGALFVGNHLGFIDVLVMASVQPHLFVTSREMRETPVLGLITEMAGCIYVERRARSNILKELGEMVDALKSGFNVILYPEATSTNGEQILPFKRTLITAAAHAGMPLVPYVFNFSAINDEPGFRMKYRDSVCWYGDIPFHVSVWRAFGLRNLTAEVEFLTPLHPKVEDDRAEVADRAREMIVAKYQYPIAEPATQVAMTSTV